MPSSVNMPVNPRTAAGAGKDEKNNGPKHTEYEKRAARRGAEGKSQHSKVRTNRVRPPPPPIATPTKSIGVAVQAPPPPPIIAPLQIPPKAPMTLAAPPSVTQMPQLVQNIAIVPPSMEKVAKAAVFNGRVEAKGARTQRKEHAPATEKPAKTTVRKKKSNNNTTSSTENQKTSSENDKKNRKSSPHTSSEEKEKKEKSSEPNKSEGSKEPSEENDKKMDKDLAQKYFKQYQNNQKIRNSRIEDSRLEKMPESSQLNISTRALRKKKGKMAGKQPLDSTIFKPNGEPVWMVADLPEDKIEKNEDGELVANPELVRALAEDDLECDEYKWYELAKEVIQGILVCEKDKMPKDDLKWDPYATMEDIEKNNVYFNQDALKFNTAKALADLSKRAIVKEANKQEEGEERRRGPTATTSEGATPPATTTPPTPDTQPIAPTPLAGTPLGSERRLKTCDSEAHVEFTETSIRKISYDRANPVASIRKYHKKYGNTLSVEQTQQESKEKL